jgi:hypothetical protein
MADFCRHPETYSELIALLGGSAYPPKEGYTLEVFRQQDIKISSTSTRTGLHFDQ